MKLQVRIIALLFLMMFSITLLSGCVEVEYHLNVHQDGSVDLTITQGYNKDLYSSMGNAFNFGEEDTSDADAEVLELKKEFESQVSEEIEKGNKAELLDTDTQIGIIVTKSFKNVDALIQEMDTNSTENEAEDTDEIDQADQMMSKLFKGLEMKNTLFTKEINVDVENAIKSQLASNPMISMAKGSMQMNLKVTLPKQAKETNATSVDDDTNTYTWNLLESDRIELKTEVYTIWFYVVIALGIVIVLVSILFIIAKMKKKNIAKVDEDIAQSSENDNRIE